jgi:hypothetical protein
MDESERLGLAALRAKAISGLEMDGILNGLYFLYIGCKENKIN